MGLRDFLFGRDRDDVDENVFLDPTKTPPHYGHLSQQDELLKELHERVGKEKEAREGAKGEPEEAEEPAGRTPRLSGFERTTGKLVSRLERARPPRWYKVTRKLEKLERKLGEAESPAELQRIAHRAVRSEQGLFKKIERGMEKRLEHLREEGATPGKIQRYERDLRKLERRLRSPSRYLR